MTNNVQRNSLYAGAAYLAGAWLLANGHTRTGLTLFTGGLGTLGYLHYDRLNRTVGVASEALLAYGLYKAFISGCQAFLSQGLHPEKYSQDFVPALKRVKVAIDSGKGDLARLKRLCDHLETCFSAYSEGIQTNLKTAYVTLQNCKKTLQPVRVNVPQAISLQGPPPTLQEQFQRTKDQPWPAKQPLLRLVRLGTEDAIRKGFYFHNGKKVLLDPLTINKMRAGTALYSSPPRIEGAVPIHHDINIQVIAGDVIDEAIALRNRGMNPVFINMANAFGPGGGYKQDHPAQEENAFRRTLYQESLGRKENPEFHSRQKPYPIPKGGSIYTPNLLAFRGNEASGYPFLPKPVELSAIAIAAPDLRVYEENPEKIIPNSTDHFLRLVKTIDNFLTVAVKHKHDAVVLSALGCGAFKNEPSFVAQCFKHVLKQPKWRGKFKAVHFAIYDDGHGPNLKAFQKHLNNQPVGRG